MYHIIITIVSLLIKLMQGRPVWGPSIYDVHTEGEVHQARVDGVKPHVDVHREN